MKTVVLTAPGEDLVTREKPIPELSRGDVLIKVDLCGICTSDISAQRGDASDYSPPVVLGHEIAGVICESRNRNYLEGQKASVDPVMCCGICYYCKKGLTKFCPEICGVGHDIDGGFAEYVRIPKMLADTEGIAVVPDEVKPEELMFLEPLACCFGALEETPLGENVVILGAGPIGLLFIQLIKREGVRIIVSEPLEHRRQMAAKIGADEIIDPSDVSIVEVVKELTSGIGTDAVIAATNDPSVIPETFQMLRRGGYANIFGIFPHDTSINLDVEQLHYSGHKVFSSWALNRKDTKAATEEISKRELKLEAILTGKFTLAQPMEAFNYVVSRKGIKAAFAP
ncbi:alcohol dehydrogenase catalytic domain-containing protein [Candidatus Poribacteria bacterium]|nr:alcohol dehydrogenase catalytic domain-containing protein [Candidatus Poribacteria bacterium]